MNSLNEAWDTLTESQTQFTNARYSALDSLISTLESMKSELAQVSANEYDPNRVKSYVSTIKSEVQNMGNKTLEDHKEYVKTLKKCGKSFDSAFGIDVKVPEPPVVPDGIVHSMIRDHFLREGYFSAVQTLDLEAAKLNPSLSEMTQSLQRSSEEESLRVFQEIHQIVARIKAGDVMPALQWCEKHSHALEMLGSSLAFDLHQFTYVQFLKSQNCLSAIRYAQEHFSQFVGKRLPVIQRLLGALVYADRLDASPYADFLGSILSLPTIAIEFRKSAFEVSKLMMDGSLLITLSAGFFALPMIGKFSDVLETAKRAKEEGKEKEEESARAGATSSRRRNQPYHSHGRSHGQQPLQQDPTASLATTANIWAAHELPGEVNLPDSLRFHTLFVCPISKEVASEENPPTLLMCGHAICRKTAERLARSPTSKFKCPICPVESTLQQCIQLHL
eukprot:ANDGO_06527.mRNA.1 LisH domain-containing protein C29A3.03c